LDDERLQLQPIKLWDTATGRELRSLGGHTGNVNLAIFSPDGRFLVTSSSERFGSPSDNMVKTWEVATGREMYTLMHPSGVDSMSFSPDGRILATACGDNSVRFWDFQTGKLLATLVSLPNSPDWLVVTPDGLFDSSSTAYQSILWRFNKNTFDVGAAELFFNEFFHPGLLTDVLTGKGPKAARSIADLDRRQPAVKLTLGQDSLGEPNSTRNIRVSVEVTEALPDKQQGTGSGAHDIRLFRNGSLVKAWRGDVLQGKGGNTVLEATIPIVAGENRLTAYAFNRDNIKSADATLTVTGADSLERAGTAYIVAIGVNQYSNSQYNLKYAVADAQTFGQQLQQEQTRLGRFANVEVISLLDREATKANILHALARLAGQETGSLPANAPAALRKLKPAEPEDTVIIYFAGHGTAYQNQFYLIPHDLGYSGSRTELDEAGLETILARSISDRELEQAFEKVDVGQLLLVIDACNSGQALEAEEKRRGPMNSKGLAQLAYEKGMYILTAAQSYQAALEVEQLGHGYLTYALVEEGLKQGAADVAPKDGVVLAREWFDYATKRVPQMQEKKMKEERELKQVIVFVEGSVQHPHVFYRREPETQPFIIAKPGAK
jgi:uncharacterized caspase-like protein